MAQALIKESTDLEAMLDRFKENEATLKKAAKASAEILVAVTKSVTPRGDPKDKPHLKALHKTIGYVYRRYGPNRGLSVVGPLWPAGAHGHLVEFGHRIIKPKTESVDLYTLGAKLADGTGTKRAKKTKLYKSNGGQVPGKYFMLRAYEMCKNRINTSIVTTLAHELKARSK